MSSAVPASEVTKVCLRLRHLIQECVPCEMEENRITAPHSRIITTKVVQAAKEAGGQEYRGCVVGLFLQLPKTFCLSLTERKSKVFCLLVNQRWFRHEALVELWDSSLHNLRSEACGVIAKALYVLH
jgi:hypothetical protein